MFSMTRGKVAPEPREVARQLQRYCLVRPRLGLVLGSGFQQATAELRLAGEVPYRKIPGFAPTSVAGHAGILVFGYWNATALMVCNGRAHYYEGWPIETVTFPVRVMAELGVKDVLLTNAAGGISSRFRPGDFMCLTDHINLMGVNPLRGATPPGQTRFVDLTETYDPSLRRLLGRAAREAGVRLHNGVYLAVSGPSYETPAEIQAFKRLGADAVGMSTVPEAIVARQCGLRVAALSCITNLAAGRNRHPLSHREVLATAAKAGGAAMELLRSFVGLYGHSK